MTPLEVSFLCLVAFGAFFFKALTGFGTAILLVALGVLVLSPQEMVPLSASLDFAVGLVLFRSTGGLREWRLWLPLALSMGACSVMGAFFLKALTPSGFMLLLAPVVLVLGIWFAFFRSRGPSKVLKTDLPKWPGFLDFLVVISGGFIGGVIGIGGPPLIWHFGRQFAKEPFRRLLTILFLVSSLSRIITYTSIGLVSQRTLFLVGVSVPAMILGTYFGNKMFHRISEKTFSLVCGLALIVLSVYHFIKSFVHA